MPTRSEQKIPQTAITFWDTLLLLSLLFLQPHFCSQCHLSLMRCPHVKPLIHSIALFHTTETIITCKPRATVARAVFASHLRRGAIGTHAHSTALARMHANYVTSEWRRFVVVVLSVADLSLSYHSSNIFVNEIVIFPYTTTACVKMHFKS